MMNDETEVFCLIVHRSSFIRDSGFARRCHIPTPRLLFACMFTALMQSDLPFPVRRGKVRDVYDLGNALLIVATDRISAFDVVMPNGIPDKGRILTALSLFWFGKFQQS